MFKQLTIALLVSTTAAVDFKFDEKETDTLKNMDVDLIGQVTEAAKSADL
jgi:hypothetical protein